MCPALPLKPGARYFFTVTAVNNIGKYVSLSSDGLVVDDSEPRSGVVFNTPYYKNRHYQSNYVSVGASWFGFSDSESFIRNFSVSIEVYENDSFHSIETKNMKFLTDSEIKISNSESMKYRFSVQASDAAGRNSEKTFSSPFIIDNSAPKSFKCNEYTLMKTSTTYSENTYLTVDSLETTSYKISILVKEASWDTRIMLKFEDEIMLLPLKMFVNGSAFGNFDLIAISSGNKTISIIQQQTPLHRLDIDIYRCIPGYKTSSSPIELTQLSLDEYQACVKTIDSESGILKLKLGLGTTENGTQICPLVDIGNKHHSSFHALLPHGSPIFVKTVAENLAHLQSYFVSKRLIVDHTPPNITILSVSLDYKDVENTSYTRIDVNFTSVDPESGVTHCSVCISEYNIIISNMKIINFSPVRFVVKCFKFICTQT